MFYYLALRFGVKVKTLENSDFTFKVKINKDIGEFEYFKYSLYSLPHIFQSIK